MIPDNFSEILDKIHNLYPEASNAKLREKVTAGYLSHNFILENEGAKFFLKQYQFNTVEKIQEIHRVKFFFAKGGIPIIVPIKNNRSEFIFEHKNKFYSLFPFVEGRIIHQEQRTSKAIVSAGAMLARMHLLSKNGFPNILGEYAKGWNTEQFLKDAESIEREIQKIPEKTDFDLLTSNVLAFKRRFTEKHRERYEDLGLKNDHIIHGDYHGNNIFYDENDEVKYIFDLEKAQIAPRILEIVRSMNLICFSSSFDQKNFDNANTFLEAYNIVYPFQKSELILGIRAYCFNKVHSLWVEKEHYLKHNTRVDLFLEQELKTLEYYTQNLDEFSEKLNF